MATAHAEAPQIPVERRSTETEFPLDRREVALVALDAVAEDACVGKAVALFQRPFAG